MNAHDRDCDRLDAAIDAVATRMVDVGTDEGLAVRIVQSLPDRESRTRWLVPHLALASAVVIALVVWNARERMTTSLPVLPSVAVSGFSAPAAIEPLASVRIADHEPRRTRPLELLELVEPLEPSKGDFDRALPAIDGPGAIPVGDLTTAALPETPSLVLAPIAISDLPMTAESFTPRQ